MEDFAKKQSGESYVDYFVRLFDNKKIYGLTCDQIAELLNTESGQTLGESAYRKEFAAFNRGRNYEREIAERDEGSVYIRPTLPVRKAYRDIFKVCRACRHPTAQRRYI